MAGYGVYGTAALEPYESDPGSMLPPAPDPPAWNPTAVGVPAAMRDRILRLMEAGGGVDSSAQPRSLYGAPLRPSWSNGEDFALGQPDFVPQVAEQVPGASGSGGYLDRLAGNFSQISVPQPNGQMSRTSQLLTTLLGTAAKTWGQRRTAKLDEEKVKQDSMERRAAIQNERNARASELARAGRIDALKESSAKEAQARRERDGWITVPSYIATAMGTPELTGKAVPPAKYNAMLDTFRTRQKPTGSGEGTNRRETLRLSEDFRAADARIGQMTRVLERRRAAAPSQFIGKSKLENPAYAKWQEGVDKLETDLAEQNARAEAAYSGLTSLGANPSGTYWKPATAPPPPADTPPAEPVAAAEPPLPKSVRRGPYDIPAAVAIEAEKLGVMEPAAFDAWAQTDLGRARIAELRARGLDTTAFRNAVVGLSADQTKAKAGSQRATKEIADLERQLAQLRPGEMVMDGGEMRPTDRVIRRLNARKSELQRQLEAAGGKFKPTKPAGPQPAAEGSTGNIPPAAPSGYASSKIAAAKAAGMSLKQFAAEVNANAAALRANGLDPSDMIQQAKGTLR